MKLNYIQTFEEFIHVLLEKGELLSPALSTLLARADLLDLLAALKLLISNNKEKVKAKNSELPKALIT